MTVKRLFETILDKESLPKGEDPKLWSNMSNTAQWFTD